MPEVRIGDLVVRDRVGMAAVIEAVAGQLLALPGADPTLFQRITLSPKRVGVVHGKCRYPKPLKGNRPGAELRAQGYVITAAVRTERWVYPQGLAHWGALAAPRTRQGWRSGPVVYGFATPEIAAGFVLAHELAHVALRQKWVAVKNTEAVTNALAVHWCDAVGLPVAVKPAPSGAKVVAPDVVLGLRKPRQWWLW
ncbi:MAG: hypothetical protein EA356_12625 [Geminicoccaceae bacterium]|nr:MAG: hypothetical protein EA356_12625 [Geminicoccaceae bacterium]